MRPCPHRLSRGRSCSLARPTPDVFENFLRRHLELWFCLLRSGRVFRSRFLLGARPCLPRPLCQHFRALSVDPGHGTGRPG